MVINTLKIKLGKHVVTGLLMGLKSESLEIIYSLKSLQTIGFLMINKSKKEHSMDAMFLVFLGMVTVHHHHHPAPCQMNLCSDSVPQLLVSYVNQAHLKIT